MGANVERVERYLRGVAAPNRVSDRHRRQLRRRILGEIENRRTIPAPGRIWNLAAAAVVLVCLGGAVGTVIDVRYHNAGRQAGGIEPLAGEDAKSEYMLSTPMPDANSIGDVVQTAQEPKETDPLAEQDDGEVIMVAADNPSPIEVIEVETNGRPGSTGGFTTRSDSPLKYTVTKGRPNVIVTGNHAPPPVSLSQADRVELSQLRQAGKGEDLGTQEKQLQGRTFVLKRERYTLRNGTRVIVSAGMPKEAQ